MPTWNQQTLGEIFVFPRGHLKLLLQHIEKIQVLPQMTCKDAR